MPCCSRRIRRNIRLVSSDGAVCEDPWCCSIPVISRHNTPPICAQAWRSSISMSRSLRRRRNLAECHRLAGTAWRIVFFEGSADRGVLRSATAHGPLSRMVLKACAYPFGLARTKRLLRSLKTPGILHYQWAHLPILDARLVSGLRVAGWRTVATAHEFTAPAPSLKRQTQRFYGSVDAVVVHTERLAEQARAELHVQDLPAQCDRAWRPGRIARVPELTRQEARASIGIRGWVRCFCSSA